jgi:hypothetical protein
LYRYIKESNTVREEFMASFGEESQVIQDTERIQKELENEPSMDLMTILLDKLGELQRQADRLDLYNMVRRETYCFHSKDM